MMFLYVGWKLLMKLLVCRGAQGNLVSNVVFRGRITVQTTDLMIIAVDVVDRNISN